jgi:hypothetical protein
LGVLVWFAARERKKQYLLFLLSGVSLYLVYAAGILGMYVFSMEDSEELLAFTRYMRSVDIAIYYLLMVFSGLMLSDFGKKQWAVVASLILVLLTAAGWRFQTGKYLKEQLARCSEEWRQDLEYPITKYGIRREDKCLLCIREDHHGWPRRIWRYNLGSATVDHVVVEDAVQLEIAKNYDYVVIFDDGNSVIEDWVQENYPNAQGRRVIEP